MRKSYGHYGRAYRSYRRHWNVGGTIALILAFILVLSAGVMVGTAYGNSLLPENLLPTESGVESDPTGKIEPQAFILPEGTTVESRPEETTASDYSAITLDQVTAANYIVIDRMTGTVLLEKDADSRIYPASTTKVMTAALALEMGSINETRTASAFANGMVGYNSNKIGLQNGEALSERDLLYAGLLSSACDAANVIADQSDLGFNNFVSEMIKRAKEIGCTGTYFVNPTGIHSSAHFSTVSDLARMETYASSFADYRAISSTASYILPATNVHSAGWNVLVNSNPLLGREAEFFPGGEIVSIDGGKTGVSAEGGYSLVCNATTANGTQLVAVISGIPYNNGAGAYVRVPEMVAILKAAATCANSVEHKTYVEAGKEYAGYAAVSANLPSGLEIVPLSGFTATTSEQKLANGETPIFSGVTDFQVKTVFYDTAVADINQFAGGEAEVGYLLIVNSSGESVTDQIPLILREK